MASFHRAGDERINVFPVGDAYLFKHYLSDEAFAELKRYYDDYEYRFEVPAERFEYVRSVLERHDYAPVVVDDAEPFMVVKRKYTDHPDILFEESVLHRSVGNFNCFVMTGREAAAAAVEAGATPFDETDLASSGDQ